MAFEVLQVIVGKKRTLEILHLLAGEGTLNYSDVEDRVDTSSDVLTNRLKTLAEYGLVERIENSQRDVRYSVTDKGEEFLELLDEIEELLSEND